MAADDRARFGTYTRDAGTGLDYAMNRYYFSNWGRFTTPDPYRASGGAANPQSWNRNAYVEGDPVNFNDPEGLLMGVPSAPLGNPISPSWGSCDGVSMVTLSPLQRIARAVESVENGLVDWVRPNPGGGYEIEMDADIYEMFWSQYASTGSIPFPGMDIPAPPQLKVVIVVVGAALAAVAALWEARRHWNRCTVRCQVIDLRRGLDEAIGYIQSTQFGTNYQEACSKAKADINARIGPEYGPQHRIRHCTTK